MTARPVITARDLTCRFGDFTAVDRVNFTIERGEIFGFLGSNGCGKTTTMKMLTGLAAGDARARRCCSGKPIDAGDMTSRYRVGYMSQSFSLYTELTVRQNLDLHARLFHLPPDKAKARIAELGRRVRSRRTISISPPPICRSAFASGFRSRSPIVHEPEMLILDEPTSGVDPLARDRFWELLIDLSRNQGVTIFVSTHFMNEAERCDRIALMNAGRVLATGPPGGAGQGARRRDARGRVHQLSRGGEWRKQLAARRPADRCHRGGPGRTPNRRRDGVTSSWFSLRRLLRLTIRETLELLRDPIRLSASPCSARRC